MATVEAFIVGIVGVVALLIGWIPETWENIRIHKTGLNLHFAILYAVGSTLLFIYSILIEDLVFGILNLGITIMSVINLYLRIRYRK